MWMTRVAIQNPVLATMVMVALCVLGLFSYARLGVEQLPDISPEEQRKMIGEETMLRAEDIAVGVHYLLTQPRRTVVQQLTIVPRAQGGE